MDHPSHDSYSISINPLNVQSFLSLSISSRAIEGEKWMNNRKEDSPEMNRIAMNEQKELSNSRSYQQKMVEGEGKEVGR